MADPISPVGPGSSAAEGPDGRRQGTGTMVYGNNDRYHGEWYNHKRWGTGTLWYANGDRYEGEWCRDMRNYRGICYYANGDKYDGEWMDDRRHVRCGCWSTAEGGGGEFGPGWAGRMLSSCVWALRVE